MIIGNRVIGEQLRVRRIRVGAALILLGVLLWARSGLVEAQQIKCDDVVKRALQQIKDKCANVPRNMICFANGGVTLETVATDSKTEFAKPGDLVPLTALKRITLTPFDEKSGAWGLVLMRVQANYPDAQPGQFVSMLLMGDVQLDTVAPKPASDKPGAQAFIFKSGTATLACKEVPPSGILLESPKGKQRAKMTMNGAEMDIGSKVFLQTTPKSAAKPKPQFVVKTLEGLVNLSAKGKTVAIKPQQESEIDLSEDYEIDGEPDDAATFDPASDDALPVGTLDEADAGVMVDDPTSDVNNSGKGSEPQETPEPPTSNDNNPDE
jgi:hypothetical protein